MASSSSPPPSLLLLGPPPSPLTRVSLKRAYGSHLHQAIQQLKNDKAGATLVIAVCGPFLSGQSSQRRTISWPDSQSLLAGLYSIISVICAKLSIPTQVCADPGSVDTRVVLVDHSPGRQFSVASKPRVDPNNTIVVDLATFFSAYPSWHHIFCPDSQNNALDSCATTADAMEHVQSLTATLSDANASKRPEQVHTTLQSRVILGGTFDHLHPGHKLLLTAAVLLLDVPPQGGFCEFICAISGDEMLKNKKYAEHMQSWDERAVTVIEFLGSLLSLPQDGSHNGALPKEKDGEMTALFRDGTIKISCVTLQDPFGPTITEEKLDALVVSGETRSGGAAVNDRRVEQGWNKLEVFEVDVLDAEEIQDGNSPTKTENFAAKISSTVIRKQKEEKAKSDKQKFESRI